MELDIPKLRTEDSSKRDNTIHIFLRCGGKRCKIIIEEECAINIVSSHAIEKLKLVVEPHSRPYTILWLGNTYFHITERCLVSIQMHIYFDLVWCNIIPRNVAHILLGQDHSG